MMMMDFNCVAYSVGLSLLFTSLSNTYGRPLEQLNTTGVRLTCVRWHLARPLRTAYRLLGADAELYFSAFILASSL
jgi:hypothetical protein